MTEQSKTTSGVQELIERLRNQGVDAGQREAQRIVDEGTTRAAQIVAEAKAEADQIRAKTRTETDAQRADALAALQLAARDTVLSLRADIRSNFADRVKRLVSLEVRDPDFLKRLILEVARQATPDDLGAQPVEILLPAEAVGIDELRAKPEEVKEGDLTHFVLTLTSEMLREGIMLKPGGDKAAGIRVRLVGKDYEIDLTEGAIADVLLRHLLPRFQALIEGVVR